MVAKKIEERISPKLSAFLKYAHNNGHGESMRSIWRKYAPTVSLRTVVRHCTAPLNCYEGKKLKGKGGRKKLLSQRDKRKLMRAFENLRDVEPNCTSKRIQVEAGLENVCNNRTIRRALTKEGYFYLQPRKKGLMTKEDAKKRLKFAKDLIYRQINTLAHWSETIAFYFDGSSFAFKTNPKDQAVAPTGRIWRKKSEGLKLGCTAKGQKVGYGGKVAHFFVAMAYNKGVISCEQYTETLTGNMFALFIKEKFDGIFEKCKNGGPSRLFLQDGDPRQNSKVARNMLELKKIYCFSIPARSPDINPIENVFHLADVKLKEDALKNNIVKETFEEFSQRIVNIMGKLSIPLVDKIIESMPRRIELLVTNKGQRIKY